jgi:hypothetical protein
MNWRFKYARVPFVATPPSTLHDG